MPTLQVMSGELREAFAKADADESVRAIVLTGAGRGFCAGADMARLSSAAAGKTNLKNEGDWPTEGLAANFAQRCSYILARQEADHCRHQRRRGRHRPGAHALLRHPLHGGRRQAHHRRLRGAA